MPMLHVAMDSLVVRFVSSVLETLVALQPHAHEHVLGGEMNEWERMCSYRMGEG